MIGRALMYSFTLCWPVSPGARKSAFDSVPQCQLNLCPDEPVSVPHRLLSDMLLKSEPICRVIPNDFARISSLAEFAGGEAEGAVILPEVRRVGSHTNVTHEVLIGLDRQPFVPPAGVKPLVVPGIDTPAIGLIK